MESIVDLPRTAEDLLTIAQFNDTVRLANPLKIGFLEGKEVYVIFRISMHGENQSYTLDYTFYLKEVSNG
ncbi:DUF6864 domain-containing function [Azotobacter chroococcum]|uniref:DUF6864 domain-containing function n=1 Tax=Azotobacter chroococcum TaxID=353 RepID=UPI0039FD1B4B